MTLGHSPLHLRDDKYRGALCRLSPSRRCGKAALAPGERESTQNASDSLPGRDLRTREPSAEGEGKKQAGIVKNKKIDGWREAGEEGLAIRNEPCRTFANHVELSPI